MSAKIITIAQHKGGAGKTTLATQLAAALMADDVKILMIDVDPQGSTTEWYKIRSETLGRKNRMKHHQSQGWRLMKELPEFRKYFDYIFIDTPPHAESESSIAVRMADLVVVPIQPSPLDIWACKPTLELILAEKKPLMLVLNRVPAKSRLNETIQKNLEAMNIYVSPQTLGNRVAFASSMMVGLGVTEYEPRGQAAEEILSLLSDIKSHKALQIASAAA
jgi:chromosome partitioning protein